MSKDNLFFKRLYRHRWAYHRSIVKNPGNRPEWVVNILRDSIKQDIRGYLTWRRFIAKGIE